MKKSIFTIVLLLALASAKAKDPHEFTITEGDTPVAAERIFIHFNSSFLLVGESLMYSLYCFENDKNKFSKLSKIAYVEFINSDLQVVFKHKIALENGRGYSDFKLPSSVRSGNYKLVGYTKLIQQHYPSGVFIADLFVLNPYENPFDPRRVVLKKESKPQASPLDFVNKYKTSALMTPLRMQLSNTQISTREKLKIQLSGNDNDKPGGTYSISVRRLDSLAGPEAQNTLNFNNAISKGSTLKTSEKARAHLLDLRGDLIEGRIVSLKNKTKVENEKVALSLPGKDFYFNLASTDNQGKFYLTIDSENRSENAFIQILGRSASDFEIQLIGNVGWQLQAHEFRTIELGIGLRNLIERRSVYNQIENAFAEVKADSIYISEDIKPFYRNLQRQYVLDDYTRFNTVKETMVEIIDDVWIQNQADGSAFFKVREADFTRVSPFLPLVFIDGLFLAKQEQFLSYPSNEIVSIGFSRDKFRFGSHIFQGILSIATEKGDYYQNFVGSELTKIRLFRPQSKKRYYQPDYSEENSEYSIPDFRQQLLWLPELKFTSAKSNLHFYTSDNPGEYEIVVQGFTSDGQAVYLRETFEIISDR